MSDAHGADVDERRLEALFERAQAAEGACNDIALQAIRGTPLPPEECDRRVREYDVAHAEWLDAWRPFTQGGRTARSEA